jgi:CubicO group peptidase (beta-lactamase class C family)
VLLLAFCASCGDGGGDASSSGGAQDLLGSCPPLPAPSEPAGSAAAGIDELVAQEMRQQGLPGMTVEIAKNGTVLYAQAYGYADLGSCRPAQLNTPYQIGSVTKQFTAAAILQLQSAGALNIDDSVLSHLPAYPFDPRITLRMLLNQTSGLRDFTALPQPSGVLNGVPRQVILTEIVQQPPQFTPGSAYQYSNSNYFVLGAVIEAITAMAYADYLAARVLEPAGLTQTSYQEPPGAARPYSYQYPAVAGATGLAPGLIPDPSYFFSAGALWSTVGDLVRWDAALRDGLVISNAAFAEMVTPPSSVPTYGPAGTPSDYGMGWVVAPAANGALAYLWHNGETLSYTSFNALTPENGLSAAVLTNADVREDLPLAPFYMNLINAFCTNTPAVCTTP